jgi:hypothetical protein
MEYYIMEKKYEFTDEVNKYGYKRIRALRDIPRYNVKAGDLGGFLESEKNLSHYGDCWIVGNAIVFGDACVSGNAMVSGDACVYGNASVSGDANISGDAIVTKNPVVINGLYYLVNITDNHMKIGCQFHTFEEWNNFTDKVILKMDGKAALNFWNEHKTQLLEKCYEHSKNNS